MDRLIFNRNGVAMKKTIEVTNYECNNCDGVITEGVSCQLAVGDNVSLQEHHFCGAGCFVSFMKCQDRTICIRDFLDFHEFEDETKTQGRA